MVHVGVALVQLAALAGFGVGVSWLNQQAPRRVSQRVFKLTWLLPTVAAGLLFFWLAGSRIIDAPARLQTTHPALVLAHDGIRAACHAHLLAGRPEAAFESISVRSKTAELVGDHAKALADRKHRKGSLARTLQPILNSILFHTGVTVVFLPALMRLLLLLWKIKRRQSGAVAVGDAAQQAKFDDQVRREWSHATGHSQRKEKTARANRTMAWRTFVVVRFE